MIKEWGLPLKKVQIPFFCILSFIMNLIPVPAPFRVTECERNNPPHPRRKNARRIGFPLSLKEVSTETSRNAAS